MTPADWFSGVAALAAAAASAFAALELRSGVRQRRESRQADLDGVAVEWHPTTRPNSPDSTGDATWVYEITAHNPGPLPVRDVVVTLDFPVDVRRRHYDGAQDAPGTAVTLQQPVILGRGTRVWRRKLVIPFDQRNRLASTTATITFTPANGPRQTNHMDGREPTKHGTA